MRTPEVEEAMSYRNGPLSCVLTMSDGSKRYGHEILAAEVERLEEREKELEADLDAYAPPVLQDGRPIFDSFGSKLRRDVRARAKAAEARAKELERIAELRELEQQTAKIAEDRIGQLEAQNARLRAALHDALSVMPEGRMREAVKAKLNGEEATHCADCDWSFPCWQTGKGCRKQSQGEEAST